MMKLFLHAVLALAIATGAVTEVIVLAGAVAEMTSQPAYADCTGGNC